MNREVDLVKIKAWLISPDPYQRGIALSIASHSGLIDEEVDQAIIRLLRIDDQKEIRRDAIKFLVARKNRKFQDAFLEALDDNDWQIRGEAIIGLSQINPDFKSISRVQQFINEETHPYGRWCAGIM